MRIVTLEQKWNSLKGTRRGTYKKVNSSEFMLGHLSYIG